MATRALRGLIIFHTVLLPSFIHIYLHLFLQVRSLDDTVGLFYLHINLAHHSDKLKPIRDAVNAAEEHDPIFLNDYLPIDKQQRHDIIATLKKEGLPVRTVLFTHAAGGNVGNSHFLWKTDFAASLDTLSSKATVITTKILQNMPKYHTRQMRREFAHLCGMLADVKPAFLREMYRMLTNDNSAASNDTTAEVDQRIKMMIDMQDPEVVVDLRENNPGRPSKYEPFWEEAAKYIEEVSQTAVHERRHGEKDVMYMATAMSASHLLEEVAKRCPNTVPIPSEQWLRLQFWPKNATTKASLQHTGRLHVKYMMK